MLVLENVEWVQELVYNILEFCSALLQIVNVSSLNCPQR